MIINIIGSPGSGKSTISANFVLQNPHFIYLSIDAFRAELFLEGTTDPQVHYLKERAAWSKLGQELRSNKNCILESSGLSWSLKPLLKSLKDIHPTIRTVKITAPRQVLLQRIENRYSKRPTSLHNYSNEKEFLEWSLTQESQFLLDKEIDSSIISIEESVRILEEIITRARNDFIKSKGKQ